MAITLYYAPNTRATRVAFLLEELGVPYDRTSLDLAAGDNKRPAYLGVHPHGLVPALRDGDTVLFETAAICLHLADRFPEQRLAPASGTPERAAYYQWVIYSVATLEPALANIYLEMQLPEAERDATRLQRAHKAFRQCAVVLTMALHGPYLVGGQFSVADVLIGSMVVWSRALGLLDGHPKLAEYAVRIAARPAFGRS